MVQLLGKNKNDEWVILDLTDDVVISLNKSIEEIEDITQRKGAYSKTFTIPGTVKNDRFFQSAFDVNITEFDATLQADCLVQNFGADIFRGTLRLNKVSNSPNGTLYEIFILEETSSLSAALERFTLCDLEFTDIDHILDYDNVVDTWTYSGGSYDTYSGIVGKVLYPLAHTGYDPDVSYSLWDFSSSGVTNSGTPITISQFKPWYNMKYLLDKCFEKAGFTYVSDFFDSDYFESIFCLAGNSETSSAALLGDRPDNQNLFRVSYSDSGGGYFYPEDDAGPGVWQTIVFNTLEYDYLQAYTLSGFPATGNGTGANHYTVPVDGAYQFRIKQNIFLPGFNWGGTDLEVALRDINTGTVMDSTTISVSAGGENVYTFLFNATLTRGQRLSIQFRRVGGIERNDVGFNGTESEYELYVSPVVLSTLGNVNVVDNLECMTGLDFFKNIVALFNLTAITEGDKEFKIEPYTTYLSSGDTRDWSEKLNLLEPYEIEPLDYSLKQEINFTKTQGKDRLSEAYFNNFNEVFGDRVFFKPSQLLTGRQEVELKFESMPCLAVGTSGTTMVIPSLYKYVENNAIEEQPVSTGMKVGFYIGLVPFYTGSTDTVETEFFVQSGSTSVAHTYYPCINHLSQLCEDPLREFSDLNFQPTWDYFKTKAFTIEIYTANNIFRQFYKEYIDQLYSNEAKFFTGIFKLTPEDITDVTFNDMIYFLNSTWRIYEITDADITEENMVKCRFIKFPYRPTPPNLVAPNYTEQSNMR